MPQDNLSKLLKSFIRFNDRADRISSNQLVDTFVSAGPISDVLDHSNNQIIYGRRGTGKTHALKFITRKKHSEGDVCVYIDCRNLGSEQSIYENISLPVTERSTRLIVDVFIELHTQLLDCFSDPSAEWDLSIMAPLLDDLYDVISDVRVCGEYTVESTSQSQAGNTSGFGGSAQISANPSLTLSAKDSEETNFSQKNVATQKGVQRSWVEFGRTGRCLRDLCARLEGRQIWLLIDEWSAIPREIQPYLADMIRRTILIIPNISVKIAAIEHRSNFKFDLTGGQYIGFEIGADLPSNLNLDDYLVFENNEESAEAFFKAMICKHVSAAAKEIGIDIAHDQEEIIRTAFTQSNVFSEFVQASEGVPRDAMHILSLCAQRSSGQPINKPTLRDAAYSFFHTEKYGAIESNESSRAMLDWVRDEVIQNRKTRAFLVPVSVKDGILNRLFDQRALHIRNKSMSSAHRTGERFVVYKIDYGCYVDLINTKNMPTGLLFPDDGTLSVSFDIPDDDARSYRRAILDVEDFYREHPEWRQ
mgnify:CR=1 FL=1